MVGVVFWIVMSDIVMKLTDPFFIVVAPTGPVLISLFSGIFYLVCNLCLLNFGLMD